MATVRQSGDAKQAALTTLEYKVQRWSVTKIQPYTRNARLHGMEQIGQLRSSFRRFGQVWPILVRADGTIIAGHGRFEAAKAEGYNFIRVIVATGWTEEQCRSFALLDNRVPLNAEWDKRLLGSELAELLGLGADLTSLGFAPAELASLLPSVPGLTDPDAVPDLPSVPVSRVGDLWLLGPHRLLCGDATEKEDVKRALAGVKPHLMVTDPPYGVNYDPNWRNEAARNGATAGRSRGVIGGRAIGKVSNDDRADWRAAWALFFGDVGYVWHDARQAALVAESLQASGFAIRAQIVWAKNNIVIGRGDYHWQHEPCWYAVREKKTGHWSGDRKQTTLWQIDKPQKSDTGHSTQKPVECMKRPIENNSSQGQAVYDPFLGSGTTLIAAEMTGRVCHAIDIDPAYVDVAVQRWQEFTGEKATLDGDGRDFESIAAERLPKAA